jgi:hypothetical protein
MAKRNPNSDNQLTMAILFGKDEASNQPTNWRKWPEPYRSIYSRMLRNKVKFACSDFVNATEKYLLANIEYVNC